MIKLGKFLTNNLGLKLISLIVAVLLWFIVLNVTDPITDERISVQLRVLGESTLAQNEYLLLNKTELEQKTITLRVQGTKSNMALLRKNLSNITAYIDLTPIDISRSVELGKRLPIRVKYEIPNASNINVLNTEPQEVEVVLDRNITKEVKVSVNKLGGDKDGYVTLTPVASPDKVVLSGPKSTVDRVAVVETDIDASEATSNIVATQNLKVIDTDGLDITNSVRLDISEVEITVLVQKYARMPISTPSITGSPPDGYSVTSVSISPKYVEIVGEEADVDNMKSITLMPIDVSGWTSTRSVPYDIRAYFIDTKLGIKNGTSYEVNATVTIESEITKTLRIPISEIEKIGMSDNVKFPLPYVNVEVRGIEAHLADLSGHTLKAKIDLTGLDSGSYNLAVRIELPEGVRLAGMPPSIGVDIAGEELILPENTEEPLSGESLGAETETEAGTEGEPETETGAETETEVAETGAETETEVAETGDMREE